MLHRVVNTECHFIHWKELTDHTGGSNKNLRFLDAERRCGRCDRLFCVHHAALTCTGVCIAAVDENCFEFFSSLQLLLIDRDACCDSGALCKHSCSDRRQIRIDEGDVFL